MRTLRTVLLLLSALPLTASAATYHVAAGHPLAADAAPGSAAEPWRTIGRAAEALEPGDRVVIHGGTYREHVLPARSGRPGAPITYEAAPGESVVITGADVLTGWESVAGRPGVYRVAWPHEFVINVRDGKPVYHHPDDAEHVRSGRAEQVIVDGAVWDSPQLVLSLDELTPGTFFPDTEGDALYLRLPDDSDPAAHRVEGSTRPLVFGASPWMPGASFDHTTVRGITFRYGASFAQRPAVWLLGTGNTVEDCTVEWMSGGGVGVGPVGGTLRRTVVRHCGHTGGCAGGTDFVNERTVWEGNCRKPISRGWDAGGVKLAVSRHGLFDQCVFRDNGGPGLWFDIDVADVVVRGCLFERNELQGLFVEISRDITIQDNAFFGNGLRANELWSVGGLTLAESRHCTVVHNLLVANLDGLALREQGPRYLETEDLGRVAFLNTGHTIAGNVMARNRRYQLGLWYDTAFFGMHPGEREQYASEEAYAEAIRRDEPDRWFDPLLLGLTIDRNLCDPGPEGRLYLYGVTWRARGREFADTASFTRATGFEPHGRVEPADLRALGDGRWELPRDSALFAEGFGPRQPIAGLSAAIPLPGSQ